MKNNTVVVYMDASLYKKTVGKKSDNNIGLGVYIIDSHGNDVKLCEGFFSEKVNSSDMAELSSLSLFMNHVDESRYYDDKQFVIYSDCEAVIRLLNNPKAHVLGVKKEFKSKISSLNIAAAYWVKGHQKEMGNLIVDTLAYNGMRECLDNNDESYKSMSVNKHLVEIFDDVKRCPSDKILLAKNEDLNKQSYNRMFNVENNHRSKIESGHYEKRLSVIKEGDVYVAYVKGTSGSFSINDKFVPKYDFNQVASSLLSDYSLLKELKYNGPLHIYVEDYDLSSQIKEAAAEALDIHENKKLIGIYRNDKEEFELLKRNHFVVENEFIERNDINHGIYRLVRNSNMNIIYAAKPKQQMKRA